MLSTPYNQNRCHQVPEFCLLIKHTHIFGVCQCYILSGRNYFESFTFKYVHNYCVLYIFE